MRALLWGKRDCVRTHDLRFPQAPLGAPQAARDPEVLNPKQPWSAIFRSWNWYSDLNVV